jgi:hypothetical protein
VPFRRGARVPQGPHALQSSREKCTGSPKLVRGETWVAGAGWEAVCPQVANPPEGSALGLAALACSIEPEILARDFRQVLFQPCGHGLLLLEILLQY